MILSYHKNVRGYAPRYAGTMLGNLLDFLFPPRGDELRTRDISPEMLLALLALRTIPKTDPAAVALLPFAETRVRSVLHEAKYHGNEKSFVLLATALTEYLHDKKLENPVFVPIPLGAKRRRARGFNQVEEVLKHTKNTLRIPIETNLLARNRETVSQISLPRFARSRNMVGAFDVLMPPRPDATYIVVDDVTTTGATLGAALVALKAAGARKILPIALAH
jgi:predicted amidophosphoribosyltransferase